MGRIAYELGEYRLVQREGSPVWYREHYNPADRKISRVSLRTPDLERAKHALRKWYFDQQSLQGDNLDPKNVRLADVLDDYERQHAVTLASAKTLVILIRYWHEFWGTDAVVADVRNAQRQEDFQTALEARGLSQNSINRVLETGQAAIRRAWKRGVLSSYPFINKPGPELDKPRGRALTVDELRAWYRGSDEKHWQDFMIIMLGTACRNGAALQLTREQLNYAEGLVYLNPEGRKQTSKRRPVVRLIPALAERFNHYPSGPLIMFHGKPVGKIDHISRLARDRAKLDKRVCPYSLRHTAARWMRQQGVPVDQIAGQLGHDDLGHNMTLRYAPHAPDYLQQAAEALDALVRRVV